MRGGSGGQASGDGFREWTVIAAVFGTDRVRLVNAGAVVASDLDVAAEQIRPYVPLAEIDAGACYLVATLSRIEIGPLSARPLATWVNGLSRNGATVELSEWVCAAEPLAAAVYGCTHAGDAETGPQGAARTA